MSSMQSSSSDKEATSTTTAEKSPDSSSTSTTLSKAEKQHRLQNLLPPLQNSWIQQLHSETTDNLQKSLRFCGLQNDGGNRSQRPVYNGHYVLVEPLGLGHPTMVWHAPDVAHQLGLADKIDTNDDKDDIIHDPLIREYLSGNLVIPETSYASGYALSIMGQKYTHNCPYGTGDGYGDGRAIAIGEFQNYELQLKGGGPTPYCRGADGRAVLRSSVRESLASEAVHHLGIPTTRALALVVSKTDTVNRPWYSEAAILEVPTMDDPRLAEYPTAKREQIIAQLRTQAKADPNTMQSEPCAITTRVARSFVRIGHVDLMARRVEKQSAQVRTAASVLQSADDDNDDDDNKNANAASAIPYYDQTAHEWQELSDLIWHACYREFRATAYDPYIATKDIKSAAETLLEESCQGIASMVANWVRVGFAQGNFNADNCLVAGRTMDYGPFGFLEEYSPLFAKWTGSGEHYGFLNQPSAGMANYRVLVESVAPVILANENRLDESRKKEFVDGHMDKAAHVFQDHVHMVLRQKFGFGATDSIGTDVWEEAEPLMRASRTDWTIFFRRLTDLCQAFPLDSTDFSGMVDFLETEDRETSAFYEPLTKERRDEWISWIETWRVALQQCQNDNDVVYTSMKKTNPKYVLREWMLVAAYNAAAKQDFSEMEQLYELTTRPYDEGSAEESRKYFRRAPDEVLLKGGTAFMS